MLNTLTVANTSLQYIKTSVIRDDGGNPTADTVKMSFVADGVVPVSGDWKTASWETINDVYYARCLVGPNPGVIQLTPGLYRVWIWITDNPETPIIQGGYVQVL